MKTKIKSIFIMSISLAIVLSACGGNLNKGKGQNANMANPASVYCEEQGYQLEMREDENGQYGVCIFPDGSECDEWAYFRGECAPGDLESKEQASDFTPFSMQVLAIYGSVISSNTEYPTYINLIIMPE
ncbi:MAG: DUF333 domain-containing protein [Anaerolineales bacterium]